MRAVWCLLLLNGLSYAQTQSEDLQKLFDTAVQAQQRGDYPLAVREYREILKRQPDAADVKLNLGAALVHLGQFDEAIATYQSALDAAPDKAAIRLNLALAYYKKNDFARAREQFEVLRKTQPSDTRVATLLADCNLRLNDFDAALAVLTPLEDPGRQDPDFEYELGLALIKAGKPREGVPHLERAADARHDAEAYMLAGSTWLRLNEFEEAKRDLEQALQLNPNLPGIDTQVGIAREKSGDASGAKTVFEKALQLDSEDFDANLYLGAIAYKERRLAEARTSLEKAIRLRPSSSLARYEIALVKSASGEYQSAAEDLEQLTKEDSRWLEPHVQLAALYYKLHRAADGAKERAIVDRLNAEKAAEGPRIIE